MAEPIGALRAELSATAAQFEKDMMRAAKAIGIPKDAFRAIEHGAKVASLAIGAMVEAFAAVGVATFAATKQIANQGDELYKLSQKVGISVEELSSLKLAAQLSDVSLESLGTAMGRLARNMDEAQGGTGEAAEAFKRLQIAVADEGKLRPLEDVLGDLADRFSRMPDGATKTALAIATLGKAGAEMIPFLNQGRTGLEEMRKEAERLGITWTTESAKGAETFNDSLTTLWKAVQGLQKNVVTDLIPAFTDLAKELTDFVASEGMREWARDLGQLFVTVVREAKNMAQWFGVLPDTIETKLAKVRQQLYEARQAVTDPTHPLYMTPSLAPDITALEAEEKRLEKIYADRMAIIRKAQSETALDPRNKAPFVPGAPTQKAPKTGQKQADEELGDYASRALKIAEDLKDRRNQLYLEEESQKKALLASDITSQVAAAEAIIQENFREAEALAQIYENYWKERDAISKAYRDQEIANELDSLKVEEEAWSYYWKFVADEYAKAREKIATGIDTIFQPFSRAFSGMVTGVLQGNQTLEEGFKRMGQNIAASLMEMVVEKGLRKIADALTDFAMSLSRSGGEWGGIIAAVANAFAGARAGGGPVLAGGSYLVGERGPELFVPGAAGRIVPNEDLGGGTTVYVDARGAQRGVSTEVMQAIRIGMGQAVNISLARVQDARRRGGMRSFDR